MRQILVAVDVSPLGQSLLEEVLPLIRRLGGEVDILHVSSIEGYADRREAVHIGFDEHVDHLRTQIRRWANTAGFAGMRHRVEVIPGDSPAEAILAMADHIDTDLIVMGSHSRSGLARVVLGSVAESVLRRAHVPVLILPLATLHPAGKVVETTVLVAAAS
ncbi:MAG TPA: universal stress protein [bacterium]|jgi:nucleotide-binding universal stress UspA family protein|nr:universal stress protein [bacterium]